MLLRIYGMAQQPMAAHAVRWIARTWAHNLSDLQTRGESPRKYGQCGFHYSDVGMGVA